ncbi:serine hydrolase domain-containing protein [Mycobacterium sp. NPDC051804]|uniref:serine hydrolase domain-containing protein n=1 Tax=Mycobacterium sp. NPDC051804 TaxID=3364295 RepID=UPI00379A89ED
MVTRCAGATRKRQLAIRLVVVALLLGACSDGRDAPAPGTQDRTAATAAFAPDESAARSQDVLNGAIKLDEPGCSAAVGIDGNVVWKGARGLADLHTGAEITDGTVFDIASVSKQFTATAVLLLAESGKLSLDDTLASHVPGLPAWADTVTVEQVMHQTSGIPDYIGLLEDAGYQYSDHTTQEQALQMLADVQDLEFAPGDQFEYSNSNYLLLADIVQRVSGQSFPAFLSAEIFKPLGLAMVMDAGNSIPGKALSYEFDEDNSEYTVSNSAWEQVGDGGVQTTPSQLVRWADNYRTGKLGGQRLLDAQVEGAVETGSGDGDRYGAGIFVYPDGSLDHDGSWAGFVSSFQISADRHTSIAVACNTDTQDPVAIAGELGDIWA